MSKSNEPDELALSELYQARKQAHRSPASIRRHVMRKAASPKTPQVRWFSRMQWVAMAAGTLLLVSLVALQQYSFEQTAPLSYTSVEIHSLASDPVDEYADIGHRYTQLYRDFLNQKALLASHHSRAAVLSQFDHGWELRTCNDQLVKVSHDLVQTLKEMDLIGSALQNGDNVRIEFNQAGLIVGIFASKQLPSC